MKIVFFGTPDFAVETLKAICKEHNILAVVTQPDKQKNRGKKLLPPPVKEFAAENGISIYQPERVKDNEEFISELEKMGADIFVVAAYGQILPERVLNIPKYGCINVHGSLLPEYRGAAPIQWAIIDGKQKTGVTIMYMEKGLDCGDMILKGEVLIENNETYETLHDKMAPLGAKLCLEALEMFEKGEVRAEKQDESKSTYAKKITKQTALIDWSKTSAEIERLIRGLNPTPVAYTYYKGEMLKIWRGEVIDNKQFDGSVGEIVDISGKKGFAVKTGDCALLITQIQAKGGKRMNTADYMRGHSIEMGVVLGSEK